MLDAEPIYEDHPVSFDAAKFGHSTAADVRRPLYWDLFSGAFGHTYGHHSVWQMWAPGREPINNPLMPWSEAIDQPGAAQMQFARRLLESRPFLTRVPDDSIVVTDRVPTSVPGAGRYRFVATRDTDGTLRHDLRARSAAASACAWTRSAAPKRARPGGSTRARARRRGIGEFPNTGERAFLPPDPGEQLDWVLVLDDAAKGYPPPGSRPLGR